MCVCEHTQPTSISALPGAALAAAAPSRDEIFDQQLADEAVERLRANRAVNQ